MYWKHLETFQPPKFVRGDHHPISSRNMTGYELKPWHPDGALK
jgi:hypothetical protein